MKSALLFLLIVTVTNSSLAKNYYFSSSTGDDSRNMSAATKSATPWRTIEKANEIIRTLQPGDSVLFKRGDEFVGTLKATSSGKEKNPIVIGAYGTGPSPVITGFNQVDKWVDLGNNIWESKNPVTDLQELNLVVRNGKILQIGRFPNSKEDWGGYVKIIDHQGKNAVTGDAATITRDWTGADIEVKCSQYTIDRAKILSQNGGTLSFGTGLTYEPKNGFGFFIQNHPATLDTDGEWYFDPGTKKLKIYSQIKPTTIRVSGKKNLLVVEKQSYVRITSLDFEGANEDGIVFTGDASEISVLNCKINFVGEDGIYSKKVKKVLIDNCLVQDCLNNGINVSDDATVSNCTVRNTGIIPGMTQNNAGMAAISNGGDGSITLNNIIRNTGYIGIKFGRNNSLVKNNIVDSFCIIKQDGGGIYAQGKKGEVNRAISIDGNIVRNGFSAASGTPTTNNNSIGIYADDFLNNLSIENNTIENTGVGIYIHNTYDIIIANNTAFNNERVQLQIRNDKSDFPVRNIQVTNNNFVAVEPRQVVYYLTSLQDDFNAWGGFTSNNLFTSNGQAVKSFKVKVGKAPDNYLSYNDFQRIYSILNGKGLQNHFEFVKGKPKLLVNTNKAEQLLETGKNIIDANGNKLGGHAKLKAFSSVLVFEN